ncbi:RIO kinase 1 [Nematocida ausubeli]|nr:RIO kinase 1 [Nematocida ausubeli]
MEKYKESHKTEKRKRDIDDRKTVTTALDKKTLEILEKLLKQGMLLKMHGAVSVGKEACIYLATASPSIWSKLCKKEEVTDTRPIVVVIKIYKTSTMVFKDRERYVLGERRFRQYPRGNSRKLVKIWAEKEVRNLNRLQKAGIPSPRPLFLRRNILIMTMIGDSVQMQKSIKIDAESKPADAVSECNSDDELSGESLRRSGYCDESSSSKSDKTESLIFTSNEEEKNLCPTTDDESSEDGLADISITTSDSLSASTEDRRSVQEIEDSMIEDTDGKTEYFVPEEALTSSEEHEECSESMSSDSKNREDRPNVENSSLPSDCSEEESVSCKEESEESLYETVDCGSIGGIAPNLKNAGLRGERLQDAYSQVCQLIKKLYNESGLVHADLSEYNMLYWRDTVYIIDVSQSVERDHPNANEFLRMDIRNVNNYFSRLGAEVKDSYQMFRELVGSESILKSPNPEIEGDGGAAEAEGLQNMRILVRSTREREQPAVLSQSEKKARRKEVKEEKRKERENKISKKDKKMLSRKTRILRKSKNK